MSGKFTRGDHQIRRSAAPVDGEYDYAIYISDGTSPVIIAECFGRAGYTQILDAQANAELFAAAGRTATALDRAGYDALAAIEALPGMVERAENAVIAYGMGWDMGGVIDALRDALPLRTGTPAPPRPETAAREGGVTAPPPVLEQVRKILDEESAWIARPNQKVEERIALAATIAAHQIVAATETMVEAENVTLRAQRDALAEALRGLSFAAQTSGGVAGRDEGLIEAIGKAEVALAAAGRR